MLENVLDTAERNLTSREIPTVKEEFRRVPERWETAKRVMDLAIAVPVLVLTSPLLALSAAAIVISNPGSPVFTQDRVGQHGRMFRMIKLRTMVRDAHRRHQQHQGILQKSRFDKRIFPVGRLLRKLSIDELPNLINVVRGEMSIVGPRPMLSHENELAIERHGKDIVRLRLLTRPGITGPWQVSGRGTLHFDERVQLDVNYATTWSPMGDVRIILKTIPVLLSGRGAY